MVAELSRPTSGDCGLSHYQRHACWLKSIVRLTPAVIFVCDFPSSISAHTRRNREVPYVPIQ